jgi:phosphotransferase family enzyme
VRPEWNEIPQQVRSAIRDMCGDVRTILPVSAGWNADFAATVVLTSGQRVFCKGARADNATARAVHFEARVTSVLPECAPGLLWKVDQSGWMLLGFEHIDGRPADLSPGSGDILLVIDALVETARQLTPSPLGTVPSLAEMVDDVAPWRTLRDHPPTELDPWTADHLAVFAAQEPAVLEMLSGRTLAHTDLHERNILINHSAHIMNWARAKLAPPWVDMAHLIIQLIASGHTPEQAEDWAESTALWRDAPPISITATAVETYGLWEHLRHDDPYPIQDASIHAARTWAMYRTSDL